jgi:hypothetical protein
MKPNCAQDHFLPKIMARLNARYAEELGEPPPRRRGGNLASFLRKHVPYKIQYELALLLGEDLQDWVVDRGLVGGLDWARTPALRAVSGGEGYIRLSIKGRERRGFFEPASDALAQYREWLEARLLEIKVADSGEALVAAVRETAKLFPGARREFLPDLILEWGPEAPAERIYSPVIGEITERLATGRGGNHCGESFMALIGPGAASPDLARVHHIRELARFVETRLTGAACHRPRGSNSSRASA